MENNMERTTKYNVGDKVRYIDTHKMMKNGTIEDIKQTDIYEWNKESKDLYLISNCPYLRCEEDIVWLYK